MNEPTKKGLVPELRFPEFRNAGEWKERKLKQVCDINPKASVLPDSFIYIDLESVEAGVLLQKKTIQLEGAPSRAQRLLKNGDVIFQMVRPYQKNNYLFRPIDDFDYVASTGYAQLRAHQSNTYLYQYIHNERFVDRVLEKCTGSNYPAINSSDLAGIRLEIPQLEEQQKIADCLSSIDELVTAQAQKVEALKAHKKGLMQQLFPAEGETVPKLRFPEFSGEWEYKSLEDVTKEPISYGIVQAGLHIENGVPYIKSSDVGGIIDLKKLQCTSNEIHHKYRRSAVHPNDIVFSLRGNIGQMSIVPEEITEANLTQGTARISVNTENSTLFVYFQIMSDVVINHINKKSKGSTFQEISLGELRKISIMVASLAEQQKISACLSSIDDLINAQTQKLATLKTHKKGLMQQLFPAVDEVAG
ncbi:restriction endonuclease subunit S [Methylomonas montana]|uniref:restriction endonuclease subunit S n=1 Tax=Methylomonas montana TaxID=3058963 RepID=UPI00265857F6|nr:restriction endonuclease subunit S [Methylomonas montana]WKJ89940.1 restriction endonuclease subunit S [Methylomonas montana]